MQDRLEKRWSPQQVSRALRAEFPGERARHVVHETIYQAVYRPELGGLSRELPARVLRTLRRRRRPHRRPGERRPNGIIAMTMIDQRPAEAAARSEPGHWEGDLITGASNRSAIGTLVDRASRYTILLHLPGRHTAEAVRDALIAAMSALPPQLRRSLTWDQGKEMALHRRGHRGAEHAGVLLRQGQPVAAAIEREHQRAAPPVLPQGQRPARARPGRPGRGRGRAEHPAAQDSRLGHSRRAARPVNLGVTPAPAGGPGKMAGVPDMRRRSPEPPAGPPEIQFKPGMANELLRELAPLLAEEGIDVDNIDVADPDTLQQALGRAVERHNMAMFTPVGHARELAAVTMRLAAEAIADGDTRLAAAILDQAQPDPPTARRRPSPAASGSPSACRPVADPGTTPTPRRPGQADPAARRALDRRTRRHRHPHPGPQGTRLRLPRRADRPARRPARPLRQRARPRRRASGLVTTRRNPPHRPGPDRHPLRPLRSRPSVASVATMAGIRHAV